MPLLGLAALWVAGCAAPAPRMFPPAPAETRTDEAGRLLRGYDTDGDGRVDSLERIGAEGVVDVLEYDLDGDGELEWRVDRAAYAGDRSDGSAAQAGGAPAGDGRAASRLRHLVIILDSVAYEQVAELWQQGRFRLFYPPSRVISPFPVMTDPSLNDLFGVSPGPGVESMYFDGRRLRSGLATYLREANAPWLRFCDYHLPALLHGEAYLNPHRWFDNELHKIFERARSPARSVYVGYALGTSALMMQHGRSGHQAALIRLDRACQQRMREAGGRLEITLLSDHGHNFTPGRRVPLDEHLRRCGYRVGRTLRGPQDAVVPMWGLVTCAAIHTRSPDRLARDAIGLEGVELAACREPDGTVVVFSRGGEAAIRQRSGKFQYELRRGDPLALTPILERLRAAGRLDGDGFAADADWLAATSDHDYPDPLRRIWRAFHELFEHVPDVFLSLSDGWYCGSAGFESMMAAAATHGNLRAASSTAFVMTTAGRLPPVLRMDELRTALHVLDLRLVDGHQPCAGAVSAPAPR